MTTSHSPYNTIVANRRHFGDFLPANAVYCGRTGNWGNPFDNGTRDENIANFEFLLREALQNNDPMYSPLRLAHLAGKILICYCAPQPCHCDIIRVYSDHYRAHFESQGYTFE